MQTLSRLTAAVAAVALVAALAPSTLTGPARAAAQQSGALERGYRTGYSDGYQAGYRDSVESAERDFRSKEDYRRADRVYVQAYGSLEDYRDGYRQGFEAGYTSGYDRRGFDSTVPPNLGRRGTRDDYTPTQPSRAGTGRTSPQIQARDDRDDDDRASSDSNAGRAGGVSPTGSAASSGAPVEIAQDTTLRVELLNNLSTDVSQRGDRFEARVLEPAPYADMVVTGRVSSVRRPGKVRGSGELQLTFQQIRTTDGRWANFNAQVIDVVAKRTDMGVGDVDEEGGVRGRSTTKDDVAKVGAATGIGALIGAIAGGGKGAAIGAAVGAGVGTGGVMTARGRDIRLERGQELMIRSATDTRIQ
ncbi:MAG TPA: hypothetical protein VK421_12375 [Pyrinomonadaceae bacterium]|nr:hypothetical protein [Pyrinomonadaceae bacterium]